MASIFDYISDNLNRFKFLKWVQIIKTESEATKKSALYLLEKSSTAFEVIVTDDSGAKRKLSGNVNTNELEELFAKIDASNVSPENAELWRGVIIGDLTDKSEDNSYNKFLTQNADGDLAVSDGRSMMIELPNILTEQQKLAWKTSMNGGWTTNTMSVAFITPFVIKKIDSNQFIAIHGVNLNFNPSNFSIKIIDDVTTNIVSTVPNNQVQLVSATQIILYFNFNSLADGNYRLLLNNGVANYTTNSKILLTSTVNNINTSLLTWEINTIEPSPNTHGSGHSAAIKDDSTSTVATTTPITTIKSSIIGQAGDNLYLDISFSTEVGTKPEDPLLDLTDARIGVCYDDFNIGSNVFGQLSWFGYRPYSGKITFRLNNLTYIDGLTDGFNSYSDRLIIIKQDNLLTMILFNKAATINTTINDEKGVSILMQLANWRDNLDNTATLNINEAYTF